LPFGIDAVIGSSRIDHVLLRATTGPTLGSALGAAGALGFSLIFGW
jgi:hypothetical protein